MLARIAQTRQKPSSRLGAGRTSLRILAAFAAGLGVFAASAIAQTVGYYRTPSIAGETVVFVSEGDLWKVNASGGVAVRLTTHPGEESQPVLSPDGKTLAFAAQYEGGTEVYTMPTDGGLPTRRTFDGSVSLPISWATGDVLLYSTRRHSTLPSTQLMKLTLSSGKRNLVPLAQACDGVYAGENGQGPLIFTRIPFQGSATKRYVGGRVQSLWRFDEAASGASPEAVHLTADYPGTSTSPMWWQGRVYFASDRDGTMNVWSMTADGKDLKQHTSHNGLDIKNPSLSNGRIAYQCGADIWIYDIAKGASTKLDITLGGDLDQNRERWVKKPIEYLTGAHLSPTGDRVILTARGQIFIAPRKQGRFITLTNDASARRRDARFMPDGTTVLTLSDQSDEIEFWTLPADGSGTASQLTSDSTIIRWEGIPSPDGKWIAHHNKDQQLFITEVATKTTKKIDESGVDNIEGLAWSPDSMFLAYVRPADNSFKQIRVYDLAAGQSHDFTTDRQDSYLPAFSPDGKFLYFLSDRNLNSVVGSPWGPMQPEPYFDKKTKVYITALMPGNRSPFEPDNELLAEKKDKETADKEKGEKADKKDEAKSEKPDGAKDASSEAKKEAGKDGHKDAGKEGKKPPTVKIDFAKLAARTQEVPLPPGDYGSLVVLEKRLLLVASVDDKRTLQFAPIDKSDVSLKTIASDISLFDVSEDGKAMLVRKGDTLYVLDTSASGPGDLEKAAVDLGGWSFPLVPRDEWIQMYREAWRLHRDYFYDRDMHKIDWKAMREKYAPLAARVNNRGELSDVLAQMVGELSALHHFVRGGEYRPLTDTVMPAFLGAELAVEANGWRVKRIYQPDPDLVDRVSPLAKPDVDVQAGELITRINNRVIAGVNEPQSLLRNLAGKQVLLHVQSAAGEERKVIVTPISGDSEADLRYHDWEYARRVYVEKRSNGRLAYVHMRAMGNENYTEFARNYYPSFTREGLIVDVRNNRGGNIDSWILSRLMRKAWFYWQGRVGPPTWNMQWAFRGPMVALCNEATASDGEAFAEGFRRLGLGKVIGTRTWGGEIWLSSSNVLVDKGIASAAETGVFGPEGQWLIEGWGVEPDIVVDNLPHATFNGDDKQLDAAIDLLLKQLDEKPVKVPDAPEHPDLRHTPGTMVKDRAPKKQ
ncbi:MAG: S41 family peptidase [Planctomycetota bacterium]|nr:S41 family peptidase [Planctomycetota bacterium]